MKKEIRDKNGLTEAEFLRSYKAEDYVRPSVAADMAIFTVQEAEEENYRKLPEKKLCILLIERGVHPYLGTWALPGGFVRPGETTEETAKRELKEETGLDHVYLEQLYTFSDPDRDPRTWVMSCSYMALIDSSGVKPKAGDDAAKAAWFSISYGLTDDHTEYRKNHRYDGMKTIRTMRYELVLEHEDIRLTAVIEKKVTKTEYDTKEEYRILSNDGLAFDHARIIAYGLERLRGKVDYTDIAFHLMPLQFTLTQLQQVYEVILDKPLLKAAFRRKIGHLVIETDSFTENAGHRPSRLYRRKL